MRFAVYILLSLLTLLMLFLLRQDQVRRKHEMQQRIQDEVHQQENEVEQQDEILNPFHPMKWNLDQEI